VAAEPSDLQALSKLVSEKPETEVEIDLEKLRVKAGPLAFPVTMKPIAQQGLLSGRYDAIADLLANLPKVKTLAATIPGPTVPSS
jgi:3-isopropylmalate dehydratase small subunit